MTDTTYTHDGPVHVAALLLFMQGAIAVSLAVEAVGSAIVFGGASAVSAVLSVAGAVLTLILVSRLRHQRRSARRWVMSVQVGWVVFAVIDLGLALALAGRGLTPVGFLVRIVLPVSIFWLLRRPAARAAFGKSDAAMDLDRETWELEEVWA